MATNNPTKVIIPCRISYAHLFEPTSVNGSDPKYGASLIIPKKDAKTITAIKNAIEQAKKDSVGKWGGKVPPNLKTPLRDGDTDRPDDEAYADSYFLNAKGNQWHFGMKCHTGVDAGSGFVHTVEATAANVHDVTVAEKLLREDDEVVYGDSAYLGLEKRDEIQSSPSSKPSSPPLAGRLPPLMSHSW